MNVNKLGSPDVMTALATRPPQATARRRLPPGWPLLALFFCYPITWMLGLGPFVVFVVAVPMSVALVRKRPLVLPRGIGMYLLFLIVVAASIVMLTGQPPDTLKSTTSGLILAYLYRSGSYVVALICALYVVNMDEEELRTRHLVTGLAVLFVATVIGGYLGVLIPKGQFTSPFELILPHALTHNKFVYELVHPGFAEVQSVLGYSEARPKAPFEYTNEWGGNLSLLLPFFILAWRRAWSPRLRLVGWGVLVAGLVPIVFSLDRGLWVAIVAMVVLGAVHLLRTGRPGVVVVGAIVCALAAALFVVSPLYLVTVDRLHHPHSDKGRSHVYSLALKGAEASPLLGWGGPRSAAGSAASIAAGRSAKCPTCGGVPVGTHGTIWLVAFSQGFVADALLVAFFVGALVRIIRKHDDLAATCGLVVVLFLFEMTIYDQLPMSLVIAMVAIALAWRSALTPGHAGAATLRSVSLEP